jgi:hypothetical protein
MKEEFRIENQHNDTRRRKVSFHPQCTVTTVGTCIFLSTACLQFLNGLQEECSNDAVLLAASPSVLCSALIFRGAGG